MTVDPPYTIYRDQLTALSHGIALWNPDPPTNIYHSVSIGDVGYLHDGRFIRMFNVMLPWDHPSNRMLGIPEYYDSLDWGPFVNTINDTFGVMNHYSRLVSAETNAGNLHAMTPDDAEGITYRFRNRGALLSLPNGGHRQDVIRTKAFEDYIKEHVDMWFSWAQANQLNVERMEDIILVSGCTLVTSWAAAAFADNTLNAEISLASTTFGNVGAIFTWNNVRGPVSYHNSRFDPQNPPMMQVADQCVFIRGFRAKRVLFWGKRIRAAAKPRPDDPDNRREDEIQVSQVPGAPKYRDPLVGVLDYIAEKCEVDDTEEGILAIAHDDDLQLIEGVENLSADTVEEYLREKQMPLLVENGAAILKDPSDSEPPVSDEKKAIFFAAAEFDGEPVPLVIHPVLTRYNLKLEMNDSSEHDYNLPKEEMNAPAVNPPMPSLKLESHQGYPQLITVEASGDTRDDGVTVQEVLRTLHEDLRMAFPRRALSKLGAEERGRINGAFRERCKNEEELSKGPRRIDHLGGRDRLQILPKFGPDGSELIPTAPLPASSSRSAEPLDESKVAGPSRNPIR